MVIQGIARVAPPSPRGDRTPQPTRRFSAPPSVRRRSTKQAGGTSAPPCQLLPPRVNPATLRPIDLLLLLETSAERAPTRSDVIQVKAGLSTAERNLVKQAVSAMVHSYAARQTVKKNPPPKLKGENSVHRPVVPPVTRTLPPPTSVGSDGSRSVVPAVPPVTPPLPAAAGSDDDTRSAVNIFMEGSSTGKKSEKFRKQKHTGKKYRPFKEEMSRRSGARARGSLG